MLVAAAVLLCFATVAGLRPFIPISSSSSCSGTSISRSSVLRCVPSDTADVDFAAAVPGQNELVAQLKNELLSSAAACDRGFGASSEDRRRVDDLLSKLKAASVGTEFMQNPTAGLYPFNESSVASTLLEGVWRLVYTDAYDVLSLAASPITMLQGIYQCIDASGRSVNVIDLTSRLVPLLPVQLASKLESVLRLKVFTAAKARSATRVGLRFLGVKAEPLSLLGQKNPPLPPLSASLPQKFLYEVVDGVLGASTRGAQNNSPPQEDKLPGFFDVEYVDDTMLVIRQNQPGGIFISSKMQLNSAQDMAAFF